MAQLLLRLARQCKIPTALPSLRKIGLHATHRHSMLLSRKIKPAVWDPLPSRHVRPAGMAYIHRRPDKPCRRNTLTARRPSGKGRRRPRHVPERNSQLRVMDDISMRFLFGNVPHDVDIIRSEPKLVCLGDVPRCQSETDGKGKGEPEVCGWPEEVIVPPDRSVEPPGRDRRIDSLLIRLNSNSWMDR